MTYRLFMLNKYLYIISDRFLKKQQTQLTTKQVKQDILNQWESMSFPKLIFLIKPFFLHAQKVKTKT